VPTYKLLRYDEDYSYLKDPDRRTDFWDAIKSGGRAWRTGSTDRPSFRRFEPDN
jgi:hypothetical protein